MKNYSFYKKNVNFLLFLNDTWGSLFDSNYLDKKRVKFILKFTSKVSQAITAVWSNSAGYSPPAVL